MRLNPEVAHYSSVSSSDRSRFSTHNMAREDLTRTASFCSVRLGHGVLNIHVNLLSCLNPMQDKTDRLSAVAKCGIVSSHANARDNDGRPPL